MTPFVLLQLIDDALDFISTSEALGKPAGADLSLGLATAPVLFAAQKVNFYLVFVEFSFRLLYKKYSCQNNVF